MGTLYNSRAKADKNLDVLAIPDRVIVDATTAVEIGEGKLCRIEGTAGGFIAFGDSAVGVPAVGTANALKTELGFFIIASTGKFIRTSAVMRIEVIPD